MGWYVTCDICGVEGKHGLECDCYQQEQKRLLARMKGCTIEEQIIVDDGIWMSLVQKLCPPSGEVFYLKINIADGSGEYACFRKVIEMTEEAFEAHRNLPKDNEEADDEADADDGDAEEEVTDDPPAYEARQLVSAPGIPPSPPVNWATLPRLINRQLPQLETREVVLDNLPPFLECLHNSGMLSSARDGRSLKPSDNPFS